MIRSDPNFNWIMVLISLLSAIGIPFIYDHIKQNRKKNNVKKLIKRYSKAIRDTKKNYKHAKNIINQIIEEMYTIEPYVQDSYNEDVYIAYERQIKRLKELGENNNESIEDYYNLVLKVLEIIEEKLISN